MAVSPNFSAECDPYANNPDFRKTALGTWYVPPHLREKYEPHYTDYLKAGNKNAGTALIQATDGMVVDTNPGHVALLAELNPGQPSRKGTYSYNVVGGKQAAALQTLAVEVIGMVGLNRALKLTDFLEKARALYTRRKFVYMFGAAVIAGWPQTPLARTEGFEFDWGFRIPGTDRQIDALVEDMNYDIALSQSPGTDGQKLTSYQIASIPNTRNCVTTSFGKLKGVGMDGYQALDLKAWEAWSKHAHIPIPPHVVCKAIERKMELARQHPHAQFLPQGSNTDIPDVIEAKLPDGTSILDRRGRPPIDKPSPIRMDEPGLVRNIRQRISHWANRVEMREEKNSISR